jgi:hypothetical protein
MRWLFVGMFKWRNDMRSVYIAPALVLLVSLMFVTTSSRADDDEIPYIEVSASGTADAAPDTALLTLTVLRVEKTARLALDANNEAMATVLAEMASAGIAARDLQTSGFSLQPRYHYPKPGSDGQRPPPVLTGYAASNQLTVRVRDLARTGSILDKAVSLGVNKVGSIRFVIDKPAALLTTAREAAVKNAVVKARTLASAAGASLGDILRITERNSPPRPMPIMRAARAMAESAVPIAAGEISYTVTVNMRWALKP